MKKYSLFIMIAVLFAATSLFAVDQQKSQSIQTSTDEAFLIQTIQEGGDSPDDIFYKTLAGKRLAVIGTDAAIPALVAMLPNEKLNFSARYALEAMPGEAVNAALHKAATELTGITGAGVIDSIGVRADATAILTLKSLLEKNPDPLVKKAIFATLGFIANEEAADILLAESKKEADSNFVVWTGLADAMLGCAQILEKAGNIAKATELYDAVVIPSFPVFAQKAGAYHGLLIRKADAAQMVVEKLSSEKYCCFSGAIKAIREFDEADAPAIINAILASDISKLSEDRQVLLIRALGDRKDETSKKLVFEKLLEVYETETSFPIVLAATKSFKNLGTVDVDRFIQAAGGYEDKCPEENFSEYLDVFVQSVAALPKAEFEKTCDFSVYELGGQEIQELNANNQAIKLFCALTKMVELHRVASAAPALVKIAEADGINPQVRDAALSALSEIVTLDNLNLLVEALNGETDDAKVDWILRAACTRLPREDCAAAVVEMYNAADLEEKAKLSTLLKQIGGPTALNRIVEACWNPETVENATKILGEWNTPDDILAVADACLKLAKESKENKYRVRGIRSYIRVPRQFNLPVDQKIAMSKIAFETAVRPEDKILIFEVFKRIIEVASVNAALSYADQPEFNDAACDAAIVVAEKIQGTSPELQAAMKTLIEKTQKQEIKDRAQKVLDRK
ncbi:MAG: hypothetical protein Q4C95_11575 [Planctomycetia bacterium]|nr:hypothetical protein [Planctomycetia bacterium]